MAETTFDAAERKILGFDHCQVGEHLANIWNLPEEIVDAARWHHEPNGLEATPPIVDCVHLGLHLTLTLGLGLGGDGMQYHFCEESYSRLGIDPNEIDHIMDTFLNSYEEYEKLFHDLTAA